MSPSQWLLILHTLDALPHERRDWEALTTDQQLAWLAFKDWSIDTYHDDLAQAITLVTQSTRLHF